MSAILKLPVAVVDFETASELDVRDVGAWRYSEHHSTHILVLGYRMPGSNARRRWIPGEPFPADLQAHIDAGYPLEAHNAQFERAVWYNVLHKRMGFPKPPLRWIDTMATAAYRGLPLALDELGYVLDLPVQKDKRGKDLLNLLSSPRKPSKEQLFEWAKRHGYRPELTKKGTEKVPATDVLQMYIELNAPPHPIIWCRDPSPMNDLYEYCMTDCEAEYHVSHMLGMLPGPEYQVWMFDQLINQRGVRIDLEAIDAALDVIDQVESVLLRELRLLTGDPEMTGGMRDRLIEWLQGQGLPWLDSLTKDSIKLALQEKNLPSHVERVLKIRQQLGAAATKKLKKMLEWVCEDGRIRGMLQYHAASTGRWAGRGPQPQNLKRPDEWLMKTFGIEGLIALVKSRSPELITLTTGMQPLEVIASAMRGMFIAAEGKEFCVSDFSAIEGVVTAWLAGEEWKLEAFAAIYRGEKYNGADDIYCATAAKLLGRPVTKKEHPEDRQTWGKVPELAFGYQGGVGAWRNFDKKREGEKGYQTDEQIDKIKDTWREEHPATKDLWYGLNTAAIKAVKTDNPQSYRYITFETVVDNAGKWLTMVLPNGRRLWYKNPRVVEIPVPWDDTKTQEQVEFEGLDQKGNWTWCRGYGGLWTENAVQAISRDILVEAMIRVEKAGYTIVLTVHDEIIAEIPIGFGSLKEFEMLMKQIPQWLAGCPIGVDGWRGTRYKKK